MKPGQDLIDKGMKDLSENRETIESLLVQIGGPRLRKLGFAVSATHRRIAGAPTLRITRHGRSRHGTFPIQCTYSPSRQLRTRSRMRDLATKEKITEFMRAFGRLARGEVSVYFTGGSTAVMEGWRDATLDIDLRFEPEADENAVGPRILPRISD